MPIALDTTAHYRPHPDAVENQLGDETVILHVGSGVYFGLDPVGTIVWQRLKVGDTPEAISAYVREMFVDAPPTVETDVMAFLSQLLDSALIERC